MLTSGCSLQLAAPGGRRRGRRGRARPAPAGRSARSGPAPPACRPRRPRASPPRRRRRPRSRASASGRGPGARGRPRRARSVTFRTRSQSWEPSNSGSKPPTSSTSARRRTLRWQVYIWVRIRSGDQSGLKNGPEWRPAAVDLVLVGVDVVGLGVGAQRLVDVGEGVGVELVVVVEQGDELARAPSPGHRWRRRRCRRSRSRRRDADPRVLAPRPPRASRRTCGCGEASSTRQSSQSPKLWRRTESSIAAQDVGRRLVDRREDREARPSHAAASARPARAGRRRAGRRIWRNSADTLSAASFSRPSVRFELGQPAPQLTEFGVPLDQQAAQPLHLLVAGGQLASSLRGPAEALSPSRARRASVAALQRGWSSPP